MCVARTFFHKTYFEAKVVIMKNIERYVFACVLSHVFDNI